MRKAILAGALGLLVGGGLLLTSPASAYNDTSCAGPTLVTVPGSGSIHGPGGDEVVCADGFGATTLGLFEGGAVRTGTDTSNGPTRVCVTNIPVATPVPVGAYVIADGDVGNAPQGQGYIGVSNNESGTSNENCTQGNNGSGTNSGGAVGPDGGPNLPIPFIVCGNTSGTNYSSNGRDGCYIP